MKCGTGTSDKWWTGVKLETRERRWRICSVVVMSHHWTLNRILNLVEAQWFQRWSLSAYHLISILTIFFTINANKLSDEGNFTISPFSVVWSSTARVLAFYYCINKNRSLLAPEKTWILFFRVFSHHNTGRKWKATL